MKPGQKIKLAKQGNQAQGVEGDLYLVLSLRPHPLFQLEDNNLVYDASVPIPDLALGADLVVPTMQGNVTMKIPERTEPGRRLRLKGKGMPGKTEAENGDLYVRLKGKFPATLSDQEKTLYQELKTLSHA